MTDTGPAIQRAIDELAIIRTLSELAQAQDDLNYPAYMRCFTEQVYLSASVVMGGSEGEIAAHDLAVRYLDQLSHFDAVHHIVTNHVIDIDGDEARCIADLFAVSVYKEDGKSSAANLGARYHLKLRRDGERWRIFERAVVPRYQYGDEESLKKAMTRDPVRTVNMTGDES